MGRKISVVASQGAQPLAQIEEVTAIQYYEGDNRKPALIWGLTSKGVELQFKPSDLEPQGEVERVVREMGEG